MLTVKTKMGARGQLVIPKIIREHLGMTENKIVVLEVKEKSLQISPVSGQDILASWTEIAKKEGLSVKKELLYGDKLYEEEFSHALS